MDGDRYLRRMMLLLVPASFFHGYDGALLTVLLPNVQETFGASETMLGLVRIPIELGLCAGFFVSRLADRFGRRPLLMVSVVGYTVFTVLTAVAPDLLSFAAFQFASRVFLATEITVAVVMVVEEYPAGRRARALGVLFAVEALGPIVVGLLLGVGLGGTALGWRAFFLASLLVLVPLAIARRGLRETARFTEARVAGRTRSALLAVWRSPQGPVLIAVGVVWLLRSIPVFGGAAWWSFYAQREQGFTEGEVGLYLLTAYALGCTGYLACARLMVWIGYRVTAIGFMVAAAVATVALFQTGDRVVSFVALAGAVGFGLGMTPVLAAFASEPFPTELRGQTGAWARSFFELPGFVLGPALVGVLGDPRTGLIGSIGQTVTWLVLLIVPACYVVWRYLPETAGRELDDLAG